MKKKVMLFLSWRDIKHPKKGGAEIFTHEMLSRSDHSKFEITHFSPMSQQKSGEMNKAYEELDGVHYIRKGNMFTVILHAMKYYFKNKNYIDKVVDQCNTHRFFTPFWVKKDKRVFFIHQMTKEIWTMNLPFVLGKIGQLMENMMTKIYKSTMVMTVSDSTRDNLLELGFDEKKVSILPEGIDFDPWAPEEFCPKDDEMFTYVGRFSEYKGIDDALEAFCILHKSYPQTTFHVVGKKNATYIEEVLKPIMKKYQISDEKVTFHGFVSEQRKLEIMSHSHCLVFPSKREGWGLTVTEAAAVGTPSIVYASPGLVDAVNHGNAGFITRENNVKALAEKMEETMTDDSTYTNMLWASYDFSKKFNWNNTAKSFDMLFQ